VREGNVIHAGPDLALVVATGCSSVAEMSAALLCWITMTRALHPDGDGPNCQQQYLYALASSGLMFFVWP